MERYDAIVIGSGQGGVPLAVALGGAGRRTLLVERGHVGGTCVNVGCTPTKTMVASARVAYLARRAADYGVRTGPVTIDMEVVRQRKRDIVDRFRRGGEARLKSAPNVELLFGDARFTAPRELSVKTRDGAERSIAGELVFINTGARPAIPAVPGLTDVRLVDSTSIMELSAVPEHLVVLGVATSVSSSAKCFGASGAA
jgi:pyruvate/2-oxoglutarate dehydrogenase complex dihydrolipoamide dehydrogenase (E3) component